MKWYFYKGMRNNEFFILNYEIKDDKMIVKLATGEKLTYPYNEENEKKIIDLMEQQVIDVDENLFKSSYEGYINSLEKLMMMFLPADIALIVGAGFFSDILLGIMAILFAVANTVLIKELIENKKIDKDFEKSKFFMENKKTIDNAKQYSKNIYNGLEKSNIKENDKITINSIDKIKLKELKRLIENMNTEDGLNMPLKQVDEEVKTKTKIRF